MAMKMAEEKSKTRSLLMLIWDNPKLKEHLPY
jgi:hypothetical protein